jgi:hypothetical protein
MNSSFEFLAIGVLSVILLLTLIVIDMVFCIVYELDSILEAK